MADVDGEPCTSNDGITIIVEVTSIADGVTVTGNVVSETPAVYRVSYQPIKCGEHEINVKVNGTHINNSPFAILVHNNPDPNKCKAIGEQVESAQKNNPAKFIVQLADAEGDPCVTTQEVTAELKSLMDGSIINAAIVSQTPASYEVAYQPSKSGEHELSVKVNGMEINGSPFALLIYNIPDPQNCKAVGEGITRAEKHKTSEFTVQLADAEGDPCVTKQKVVVELRSRMDGSITMANVVSKTPATYAVSCRSSKIGEHELSVKVNDIHIEGSPFALLVVNRPHAENCKAIGEHVKTAEKNKAAKFMIQLADEDGEPCATKQEVTVELKALLNGSITEGSVVSITPATYEVSYQPRRSGRHELSVKVNGMPIKGSPFAVFVHNKPHPKKCKAIGEQIEYTQKNNPAKFIVQLADEDGDPCVTTQEVTAELKSLMDGSIINAAILSQTPATYEVAYQPSKSGEHEIIVKVNGMEINGSPFALLVHNFPDPKNCKAEGITKAEKHKTSEFMVQLADTEGDPCVIKQEVVIELKSLVDGSIVKADVVSKTPATYAVSYRPSKSGEHELSVKVNGIYINGSPFALFVHNIPDRLNCKAVEIFKSVKKDEKFLFIVQLADAEGDPCVTRQNVKAQLKSFVDGSVSKANVVSKTPASYEVSYQPSKSGQHQLCVKVNGMPIIWSHLFVYNNVIPDPQNCKAVGIVKSVHLHEAFKFIVNLADAEGESCVTRQNITVQLKALVYGSVTNACVDSETPATYAVFCHTSKIGEHELSVKVNGVHINGSPFAVLVYNTPDPRNCKAVGIVKSVKVYEAFKFIVKLAGVEGEPCFTRQDVTAQLISADDYHYSFNASVIYVSKNIYEVSCQPRKCAEYKLIVKVNGREINSSPFDLLVYNIPHPQNCKVKRICYAPCQHISGLVNPVTGHMRMFEQPKTHHSIIVELADKDGEPCITTQKVTATMNCTDSLYHCKVHSLDPATYRVDEPEQCPIEISKLTVHVNGMTIQSQGSPLHTNRQWSSGFSVQTSVEASKPKSKKKLRASTTSPEPAVTSTGPYTSYPFTRQGLPPHTSPAWTTAASRSSSQTSMEASKPKPIASTTSPEPAVTTTGPYTSYPFTRQGLPPHTNPAWTTAASRSSSQTSMEASKPKPIASTTSPEPAVTTTGPYTSYPFTRQGLPPHTNPAWTTAASRSSSQTSMEASKPKPIASTTSPEPAVTTTGPYTSYPFTSQGLPPRISRRTQTSMEASKPKPIASTTSPELVVTTTGPYTSNPFTSQGLPPRISRRTQTSMEASKPKPRASTTSPELVVTTTGPYTSNPFTSQGLPPHISRRAQTSMEASKPKPIVSTTSPELVVTTTGPYTSNPFTSQGLPPHISRRAQTSMEASKPKPIASTTSPELVASHYYRALHQQPLHQARTSPSHQPQSLDHDHSRWTTAASSLVHRLQ